MSLQFLVLLACPVSMGVMMWMMMRGGHSTTPQDDPRIAAMQREIEDLRRQQAVPIRDGEPAEARR